METWSHVTKVEAGFKLNTQGCPLTSDSLPASTSQVVGLQVRLLPPPPCQALFQLFRPKFLYLCNRHTVMPYCLITQII